MAAFTEEEINGFHMNEWYDLDGEVAIVTGGGTGLGLAITRCLVSAGAKVAVVSRKYEKALEEFGDNVRFYEHDISNTEYAPELVEKIVKDFGKYYDRYMRREITKSGIANELGISRPTVDRLIREHQKKESHH